MPHASREQFRRGGAWRLAAVASLLIGSCAAPGAAAEAEVPALPALDGAILGELEPAARQQVLEAYREARRRPDDAAPAGKLGMIFQAYGKFEAAEICFRRAQALAPGTFRWTYYLGNVEGLLGKYPEAIAHLQAALQLDSSYVPARVRLAQLLFDAGEIDQSRRLCEEALRRNSRLASGHFCLGKALAARGDWQGAITAYRRALELFGNYAAVHYALGMAYRKTGEPALAAEHLRQHERLKQARQPAEDPLMEDVKAFYAGALTHVAKGAELAQQGKLREAAAEFEAALQRNPDLMMAHVNLIAMYGQLGMLDQAERHFRAAERLDPGWVEIYHNWGLALLQKGHKEQAAAMFRKAIEVNPNYAEARVQLGALFHEQGRLDEAAAEFERALQQDRSQRQAHFLLADILARRGRLREAIAHLLETVKIEDQRTPFGYQALAIVYERLGDRRQSAACLEEALRRARAFGMQELVARLERERARLQSQSSTP